VNELSSCYQGVKGMAPHPAIWQVEAMGAYATGLCNVYLTF
jgi:hypothetical protein